MPQTIACVRPFSPKPSARAAEKTRLLDHGLLVAGRSRARSRPSPFGYCSLTSAGMLEDARGLEQLCRMPRRRLRRSRRDGSPPARRSPRALRARERAGPSAQPPAQRAIAVGERPRRRSSRAPGPADAGPRSSSSPSGSPSRARRPPTLPRGPAARRSPAHRRRAAASGSPNSAAPARHPLDAACPSSITPGSTSSVWSAAKAVSRPVVPIGACSKGTSFSSRACGA